MSNLVFYRLLRLPHLRSKVGKDNTVDMVDLMLEDTRQPAINFEFHRLSAAVETPDANFLGPFHFAYQRWDR